MMDFFRVKVYNAFNVYCREVATGTVSLTGDRAQGDDSKHCAYSTDPHFQRQMFIEFTFNGFVEIIVPFRGHGRYLPNLVKIKKE